MLTIKRFTGQLHFIPGHSSTHQSSKSSSLKESPCPIMSPMMSWIVALLAVLALSELGSGQTLWTCNTKANTWTPCYSPAPITPTSSVYARYEVYEAGNSGESSCKAMNVMRDNLSWVDMYRQESGHFVTNPYWNAQGKYYYAQITCYTFMDKNIQWSFKY